MSVDHKTVIIVGLFEERFFELFPAINLSFLDNDDDFVDEFCINVDYWCDGQHFIGHEIAEVDACNFALLNDLVDNFYIDEKKEELQKALVKNGFNISLNEIKTFIINQIF